MWGISSSQPITQDIFQATAQAFAHFRERDKLPIESSPPPVASEAGKVKVSARLRATGGGEGETREYSWGVYEFPVDYSVGRDYCDSRMMGRRPIHNLVRNNPPL